MARAIALGDAVLGTTSPNPSVGAVIVKDGRIVGEGATLPPGGAHAERVALAMAGEAARGAALWCTLEPCPHTGRTGPCTEAIIAAGIREVHYALDDPDALVNGGGRAALEGAGIAVYAGEGAEGARRLHEGFLHQRRTGRPLVIAKFAASLDGKIAATGGDSRWVSGPETRAWAHRMRPTLDAIIVGVETVLIDNPLLTARPEGMTGAVHQPLRVVVDSRGRTPLEAKVLSPGASTLVATTAQAGGEWRRGVTARGAEVVELPQREGRVNLAALVDELGRRGALQVLVEGGGVLLGGFFDLGLVDKVTAVIAPLIIGGESAAVGGRGATRMADALRLRGVEVTRLGDDILVTGYTRGEGE
ncbi:MAG: bifunctional diaminohydroxyphosphoribosylaminopyrimidine deaminase/5-amino-6-(5-phosphoribosylamino)uracil reductase RibD [Dehalococcoidia bacterium]|nr:bifunctional diaminohydroxyphosphoribosylaminopyrimidine deaminase/5-amino-6-(5-phosphoribosylamino)uracil reductase RibD [Dehalococcoidia bacterium]